MIDVAAPVRVAERLRAAADGPREVAHAGRHALYVDLDGDLLGLLSAPATRVPCGLWSRLPDLHGLAGPVLVRDGCLLVAGERVRVTRLVDVRVPVSCRSSAPALTRGTEPLPGVVLPGGRLTADHVPGLLGRGPGLTPLGDDVLAGWLLARYATGAPDHAVAGAVRRARAATTALSGTLLDCAARGESLPEVRAWLAAAGTAGQGAATDALLRVGATSGAGLLAGAARALCDLREAA